tara:strand:- start:137 stop:502 length:366 start_codon:yes stop_codon:yes gene_type:complete
MTTNAAYDNTSHRTFRVQGGIYSTDDSGASSDNFIIAQNTAKWGPDNEPVFTVLGHYSSEGLPPAAEAALQQDRFAEWLQEEAVALAEKQNLVPENTILCIVSGAFLSCVLMGAEGIKCLY